MAATGDDFLKSLDKKLWTAADKLRANLDASSELEEVICKNMKALGFELPVGDKK